MSFFGLGLALYCALAAHIISSSVLTRKTTSKNRETTANITRLMTLHHRQTDQNAHQSRDCSCSTAMPTCIALRSTDRTPKRIAKARRTSQKTRHSRHRYSSNTVLSKRFVPTNVAVTAATCHNGSAVPLHPFESRQKTSRSHTVASRLYHEAQDLDDFAGRCGEQIRGE